jgi:phage FluMu protein Com
MKLSPVQDQAIAARMALVVGAATFDRLFAETGTFVPSTHYEETGGGIMDPTRCPHCNRRMMAVATPDGRTGLKCLQCDKVDPLKTDTVKLKTDTVKWADSPLAPPTKAA